MPNPFPGMNPYLEDPRVWGDVHHRMLTYVADALQRVLPKSYAARLNLRVFVSARQARIPDVMVIEKRAREVLAPYAPVMFVADDAPPAEPLVVLLEPIEEHQAFVEIVRAEDGHVVTVIEVLSPSNKNAGEGRAQYLKKQCELLSSGTHLVEIDLLKDGLPTLAVLHGEAELPPHRYLISVRRAPEPYRFEVYPVKLQERLPKIRIPLMPPDADVFLSVQSVLNMAYENGAYDRLVDYANAPQVTLDAAESQWLDECLRAKTLR